MKDTAWSNALQHDLSHVGIFKIKQFADKDNRIKQWLVWIKMQYFHDVSQFGIIRDILVWEKDQFPVCWEMTKVRKEVFGRTAWQRQWLEAGIALEGILPPLLQPTLEEQCLAKMYVRTPYIHLWLVIIRCLEALYSRVAVLCCKACQVGVVLVIILVICSYVPCWLFLPCLLQALLCDHSSGQDLGILTETHTWSAAHGVCSL